MTPLRVIAIAAVFAAASIGWLILGQTVQKRTDDLDHSLAGEMASLWGPKVLVQTSPWLAGQADALRGTYEPSDPAASEITADIGHEHRYKGLLWYSTFDVDFTATYRLPAAEAASAAAGGRPEPIPGVFVFPLPDGASNYRALSAELDGMPVTKIDHSSGRIAIPLDRSVEHVVKVHYETGGQDAWVYSPGDAPRIRSEDEKVTVAAGPTLRELRDFSLTIRTNFTDIDYPRGTLSPKTAAAIADGKAQAVWTADNLITRQSIGMAMPKRPNAGPIVARMSLFAPVSLAFFFTVLLAVVVLKAIPLHPMHLLLVAAGFFAFHILLSYLADVINIHPAFWISAAVSVLLVTSYLRLVAGVKFGVLCAGLAQLVYLVGFSYAFFWVGRTGLTVTICAVVTLFILMQATGRLNWHEVFAAKPRPLPVPPPVLAAQAASNGPTTLKPTQE